MFDDDLLELLKNELSARKGEARVLEFGSGLSTPWFAARAASVVSVEHAEEWLAYTQRLLGEAGNTNPTLY
jgi:predicted O-methyltransferase YrrM